MIMTVLYSVSVCIFFGEHKNRSLIFASAENSVFAHWRVEHVLAENMLAENKHADS